MIPEIRWTYRDRSPARLPQLLGIILVPGILSACGKDTLGTEEATDSECAVGSESCRCTAGPQYNIEDY